MLRLGAQIANISNPRKYLLYGSNVAVRGWLGEWVSGFVGACVSACVGPSRFTLWTR